MAKEINFSIGEMMSQFEADHHDEKKGDKPKPRIDLMIDELTCHMYVSGTLAVLAVLGMKDSDVLHVNDRTTLNDFPTADLETMEELQEMTGLNEVTLETPLWQLAKALVTGDTSKYKPHYH